MNISVGRAAAVTFGLVGACLLVLFVMTAVARSQGGGIDAQPVGRGRAELTSCMPDVVALGLRQMCEGEVRWADGRIEEELVFSPRAEAGQHVDVLAVKSREVVLFERRSIQDAVNVLTVDHPRGNETWYAIGAFGPISLIFGALGIAVAIAKLRQRIAARRRSESQW